MHPLWSTELLCMPKQLRLNCFSCWRALCIPKQLLPPEYVVSFSCWPLLYQPRFMIAQNLSNSTDMTKGIECQRSIPEWGILMKWWLSVSARNFSTGFGNIVYFSNFNYSSRDCQYYSLEFHINLRYHLCLISFGNIVQAACEIPW